MLDSGIESDLLFQIVIRLNKKRKKERSKVKSGYVNRLLGWMFVKATTDAPTCI
jgi:hypothetical protein